MNSASDSDDNPSENQQGYTILFSSLGFSLWIPLIITLITFISYHCRRRSLQNGQQTANTNMELDSALSTTIQVPQEEAIVIINSYPVLLYSQAKQHKPPDDKAISSCCSICLADYKDTDLLKFLPECGHTFHSDCIDRWFRVNLSCPMCRTSPLPTPLVQVTPLATRHE